MTASADVSAAERGATAEWRKCPSCSAYVYHKRLKRQLGVCPECNHHFRIRLWERLDQLLDPGSFEELGADLEPVDALGFVDSKPYPTRIASAQKGGRKSGAVYGTGDDRRAPAGAGRDRLRVHRRVAGLGRG